MHYAQPVSRLHFGNGGRAHRRGRHILQLAGLRQHIYMLQVMSATQPRVFSVRVHALASNVQSTTVSEMTTAMPVGFSGEYHVA